MANDHTQALTTKELRKIYARCYARDRRAGEKALRAICNREKLTNATTQKGENSN